MKKIKIFGERNTGTNYLLAILSQNFEVGFFRSVIPRQLPFKGSEFVKDLFFRLTRKRNLGWKHAIPPISLIEQVAAKEDMVVITLSKNPYSFLLSLYKRPYGYIGEPPETLEAFLRTPWKVLGRDLHTEAEFATPIDLWNIKNRAYIELKKRLPDQVYPLKYEALITDPITTIQALGEHFHLPQKHAEIVNYEKAAKSQGDDRQKDFTYYRNYYLQEKWRDKLSEEAIRLINERLDLEVAGFFGYPPISL